MGQGLFPEGGAEIFVRPPADLNSLDRTRSPKELANENVQRFSHGRSAVEAVANVGNPDISDVFRAGYDYQRVDGEDLQRDVLYYFKLGDEAFVLGLSYWKDDTKAESHEQVLLSILKSIRRTGK